VEDHTETEELEDMMYQITETSPSVETRRGCKYSPLITLADEYGGISHIVNDDNCYVLVNGSHEQGFDTVKHWYPEAAKALSTLKCSMNIYRRI